MRSLERDRARAIHKSASLRIACDLDGTLADIRSALQREAARIFGDGVDVGMRATTSLTRVAGATRTRRGVRDDDRRADTEARPLDIRERSQLWSHLREIDNFWETLPEIEAGAVVQLAETAAARGWDVLFVTRRPDTAGDTVQAQSQRWLRKHGFEAPRVSVVPGSRGTMAASLSLDTVIDDSPENCVDVVADSSATPLLVWRDAPEDLPPGLSRLPIRVVWSMAAAIEYLTQLPPRPSAPVR